MIEKIVLAQKNQKNYRFVCLFARLALLYVFFEAVKVGFASEMQNNY